MTFFVTVSINCTKTICAKSRKLSKCVKNWLQIVICVLYSRCCIVKLIACQYNVAYGFGGVSLKTLLVHFSYDNEVKDLCSRSESQDIDVLELRDLSRKSFLKNRFGTKKTSTIRLRGYDVDLNEYDNVILATDETFGNIAPAMKVFIRQNELRFKNVICLVFGEGRSTKRAADALRTEVSLSGGTASCVISVSTRAFKREAEDLLFYVRHRLHV